MRARVTKIGATTGRTTGRVGAVIHDIAVRMPAKGGGHSLIQYPPLIEVVGESQRLCGPGDSGSVFWLDEPGYPRAPVGLLCSTVFRGKGYAIPMKLVTDLHSVSMA